MTGGKTGASMELPLAEFYWFADGLLVRVRSSTRTPTPSSPS